MFDDYDHTSLEHPIYWLDISWKTEIPKKVKTDLLSIMCSRYRKYHWENKSDSNI